MLKKTLSYLTILAIIMVYAPLSFSEEAKPLILFDQGHGQRFVIEHTGALQLSKLVELIRAQGAKVEATKLPLANEKLTSVSALVISGPFEQLRPEEVDAIAGFVERGGRLAVMLHIGSPLSTLLQRLGLDHSNSVLHERRNLIDASNDMNFLIKDLSSNPLFKGLDQFSAYGVWALRAETTGVTAIARTSPMAWVDLNGDKILSRGDTVGAFEVVVTGALGAGSFIIFGDDAIFQNRYLDENNSKLAVNLGAWLIGH